MMDNRRPVPKIGVDMLYVAPLLQDDQSGAEYGEAWRLPGLSSMGYQPNTQTESYDADDGTYMSYSADGTTTLTIQVADVLPEHTAKLLGLTRTADGVIEEGTADNPPEMAVGWRSQKSDGSYRFVWVLKGKFSKAAEEYATKSGDGIRYMDRELVFTALNRISDGKKRRMLDSDDPALPAEASLQVLSDAKNGWFSSPDYVPEDVG